MVQLLSIPEYRFELLTGLITSAGGLTESLVRIKNKGAHFGIDFLYCEYRYDIPALA
jgi:hypothetical protein